jgi:hypothetical protein
MAVVYQNPTYPFQVSGGSVQAASTQLNYRQMLSEITSANPDVDPMVAGRWINNSYRRIIDKRSWYGLKIRGQVTAGNPYNTGFVNVTQGSSIVNGIGTAWSTAPAGVVGSLVGLQFRTSFTLGYQTIVNVISPTQLQLDTPYSSQTLASTGYYIAAVYMDFGANVKRLLWAVNQQQGWPMNVNVPVQVINARDTWRISLGWSTDFAVRSMSPTGSLIMELWPAPYSLQSFPFEAYQQPPDLVMDNDAPVPWIASDLIVAGAMPKAYMHGGPRSKYYDSTAAAMFRGEYKERLEEMGMADNNMDQQDVSWDYGMEEGQLGYGNGSTWAQNHG